MKIGKLINNELFQTTKCRTSFLLRWTNNWIFNKIADANIYSNPTENK